MNELQQMIAESVNRMFAGLVDTRLRDSAEGGIWPTDLWRSVEESGFSEVLVAQEPAEAGGGLWVNALPVLEAIGFYQLPLPLAETIVARGLLAQVGLSALPGPSTVIQQARPSPPPGGIAMHVDAARRLVLDGSAEKVPWARFARAIVVEGMAGQRRVLGLVHADAAGIRIEEGRNMANEARDRVTFSGTPCNAFVECEDTQQPDVSPVRLHMALARAAMLAGAARSVLRQAVQYANDRVQFGRPIGKFQAIQQSLAVLAGEVTSAQSAVAAACQNAGQAPQVFDVAVSKIRAGQAAGVATNIGHQVHGAIGFTYEHALHYATRRLWSWRAEFGGESEWAGLLGRAAVARGGAAFWADLTARTALR